MNANLIKLILKLKNASASQKELIFNTYNVSSIELLKLLYAEGFIQSFSIQTVNEKDSKKNYEIKVTLRYFYNKPTFKNLKIVSSPSYTKYMGLKDLSKLSNKKRVLVLSTNKGLLTGLECKKQQVGGTLLFVC